MHLRTFAAALAVVASVIVPITALPATQLSTRDEGRDSLSVRDVGHRLERNVANTIEERSPNPDGSLDTRALVPRTVLTYRRTLNMVLHQAVGKFAKGTSWVVNLVFTYNSKANKGKGSLSWTVDDANPGSDNAATTLSYQFEVLRENWRQINYAASIRTASQNVNEALTFVIKWCDDVYWDLTYNQVDHYIGDPQVTLWPNYLAIRGGTSIAEYDQNNNPIWEATVHKIEE